MEGRVLGGRDCWPAGGPCCWGTPTSTGAVATAAGTLMLLPSASPSTRAQGYEGFGTARVKCVAGCRCHTTILDGTWAQQATLMQTHTFWCAGWGRWLAALVGALGTAAGGGGPVPPLALTLRWCPSTGASVPWCRVTQAAECRVRVTVRRRPGAVPQRGQKVKLMVRRRCRGWGWGWRGGRGGALMLPQGILPQHRSFVGPLLPPLASALCARR